MRNLMHYSKWLTLLLFSLSLTTFIACDQQSPVSPDSLEQPGTEKNLTFLKFQSANNSLNKIITVTDWVTQDEGGELKLSHKVANTNGGNSACKIVLTVAEETISDDAELSISLDDTDFFIGNFDMVFSPHGIVFSEPAKLNIEIKNADFSGLNPEDLNIYYDNPDNGTWELMPSDEVIVDVNNGYIKIVNAEIPHFSRYAIGTEN